MSGSDCDQTPRQGSRRRRALIWFILLAAASLLLPALAAARTAESVTAPPQIRLVDAFPNLRFQSPIAIAHAGDSHLFVVEQPGRIWRVEGQGGAATRSLFLDITDRVQDGCERGLLGLAFHPDFAQNGYFYVNYITHQVQDGEEKDYTRVSRFRSATGGGAANPATETVLMEIYQPYCNHNGGDIHFDPSGMLVFGLGDGGSGGDPHHYAQNPQSYLGKLLRIDVDRKEADKNYAIPADNPFAGPDVYEEILALGLRNPWRFSFDRQTGDLYIGDVGQNTWEEVNYVPAAQLGGQNFEWSLREGFMNFNLAQPVGPGLMTAPVHVYEHAQPSGSRSITGGYVYRGDSMAGMDGVYIYADFETGSIFGLWRDAVGDWQNEQLGALVAQDGQSGRIVAFGEDSQGELYLAAYNQGIIYRLIAPANVALLPLVSVPGSE
ncbi:MAG: PQQ-dependent sugar dehydrogenase [Candidatus Promineifilaceae bacterium]